MYDPPSGWIYDFPKPYNPWPGESLEETLLRDGYPKESIEDFDGKIKCRFFDSDIIQSEKNKDG